MFTVTYSDILSETVDAIVNPANTSLLSGSGLCDVIHKRAGIKLEDKCKNIGKQEIGNAIVTPAFELSSNTALVLLIKSKETCITGVYKFLLF